ncbi:MAG TPA: hypothetical protein VHX14_02555 [Thermoanaerobaculia bacterium]|jgi:hypothetical protein|nr:hypothetical protein [Thermoanaerobaculia bacterium]
MNITDKNIDETLQRTLARTRAPEGFADRVLARIDAPQAPQQSRWLSASALRRIAAVILFTAALGGLTAHQIAEHRRAEGELAKREVMTALHIASAKMHVAQRAVSRD